MTIPLHEGEEEMTESRSCPASALHGLATDTGALLVRAFAVSVEGFPPGTYVAASRGRALARCHDDYRAFNPITFGDFLKIARAHRVAADEGFGAKIRVCGEPAYRVGARGQYVQFVRPGETVLLNSHPADVQDGW